MAAEPNDTQSKPLTAADFAMPPLSDPAEPPESCQDWDVHLKLTPERHASIARSWSMEEANYRQRNQRAQSLLNELVIHHIGNVKTTAKEVHELAQSLADLKKHDVALDRVRAQIEIEKIRAQNRLEIERIRAQSLLDLEDRRHKHRMERIDRHQKNWLVREITRQKNRLALEDRRGENRLEIAKLKAEVAREANQARREAAAKASSLKPQASSRSSDPYPPGARYGRDPETGRPYTRKEFMKHLREACYDVYGLNLPGEGDPKHRPLHPDKYEHLIDENGDLTKKPYHDYVKFDPNGPTDDYDLDIPPLEPRAPVAPVSNRCNPDDLSSEPHGPSPRKDSDTLTETRAVPNSPDEPPSEPKQSVAQNQDSRRVEAGAGNKKTPDKTPGALA